MIIRFILGMDFSQKTVTLQKHWSANVRFNDEMVEIETDSCMRIRFVYRAVVVYYGYYVN